MPSFVSRHVEALWLVSLLRCRDDSRSRGITNDLPTRLKAHAAGKASRDTRCRLPVTLAHAEPQRSILAALKREAATKRLPRDAKQQLVARRKRRSSGCLAGGLPTTSARPGRATP